MKRSNPLMLPRSVQAKKKSQAKLSDQNKPSCDSKQQSTSDTSTVCEIVRDVLTEIVNGSCVEEDHLKESCLVGSQSITVADNISCVQEDKVHERCLVGSQSITVADNISCVLEDKVHESCLAGSQSITIADNISCVQEDKVQESCLTGSQSVTVADNLSCVQEDKVQDSILTKSKLSIVANKIKLQVNVPYVDVGPLSYNKMVPVYHRSRNTVQQCGQGTHNFYKGLAWEPSSVLCHGQNQHHSGHHRSDQHYSGHNRSNDRQSMQNQSSQQGSSQQGSSQQGSSQQRSSRQGSSDDHDCFIEEEFTGYYPRQWEYTEAGRHYLRRPASHRGFEFTIMSYNILAQNLLKNNIGLYSCSPSKVLNWKHRRRRLMKELKYHSPDIICLQEVFVDHYKNFFLPELQELGYKGEYMKRTGDKLDGCATFYKKRKFDCVEVIKVPYCHKHGGSLLDRDNVGLIVKLKPQTRSVHPDKRLVVANTHLLFNPRRGDIKLAQLMVLLAELDKCAYTGGYPDIYHAVIMCGDFNSEPHSDIYKLAVMGYLEYEGLLIRTISGQQEGRNSYNNSTLRKNFFPSQVGISDYCRYCNLSARRIREGTADVQISNTQGSGVLQHHLRMVSAYEHKLARLNYRYKEITTHHGSAACSVDYIFYGIRAGQVRFHSGEVQTKDTVEGHLCLLACYGLLSEGELDDMGSLPNTTYGSDHLSLLSRFLMT